MLVSLAFCSHEREPAVAARCLLSLGSTIVIQNDDVLIIPEQTEIEILDPSAAWVRNYRYWKVAGKLIDVCMNHLEAATVKYRVYPATNEDVRRFRHDLPEEVPERASTA